jgi:hypothetical protein
MSSPIDFLISAQHTTGGWGYAPGYTPVVEPTAAVLLAIRNEPAGEAAQQRGLDWLLSSQNQDGGWGINADDEESNWHTAWALIALRYASQKSEASRRGVDWLTTVGTAEITTEELERSEGSDFGNPEGVSWPWLPGQACWTEPTALAMLALEGITNTPLATMRLNAALGYFQRFRTMDGGWEIGNAGPLDSIIVPRAHPTALVLLALHKFAPQEIQAEDLNALRQDMQQDTGVLAQSCGLLALRTLGEDDETTHAYLVERQLQDGSWNENPYFTAWAMMALKGAI